MTATAAPGAAAPGAEKPGAGARLLRIGVLWAILLAGLAVAFPEQFADPFVRSDDYPLLLPAPDQYYHKTLTEGRWINWLWSLRPWPTDPVVLNWLQAGAWTLTAALVGVGVAPGRGQAPAAALVAIAFVLMPQHGFIALWFNTLIPAVVLLAGLACVAVLAPRITAERVLIVAVPFLLMTHTTYPFIALAMVAGLSRPEAGPWRVVGLAIAFGLAIAAGLLAIYAINWLVHGHFGIAMPAWREPNPLTGIADLPHNLRLAAGSLLLGLPGAAMGVPALTAVFALLVAAVLAILWLAAPRLGWAMTVALGVGVAVPGVHMVLSGVEWPYRATGHLHAAVVIVAGLAFVHAARAAARAVAALLLLALIATGALTWNVTQGGLAVAYQAETRAIAGRVAALDGSPRQLLVVGEAAALPGGTFLHFSGGLRERLALLTGLEVHICSEQTGDTRPGDARPETEAIERLPALKAPFVSIAEAARHACAPLAARVSELPAWPRTGAVSTIAPGIAGLRLPDEAAPDP